METGQRLAALLEMLRTDPEGEVLSPDAYVFGDEVSGAIAPIKTTRGTACEKAGVVGLHFHDLRHEFACRLLKSRAELHDVRDFLGHTNLTTAWRYLRPRRCAWSARCVSWRNRRTRVSERRPRCARTVPASVPHQCCTARLERTTSMTRSTRTPLMR